MKKTIKNHKLNLKIQIDTNSETPVMVYLLRGIREIASATYTCATDTGEILPYKDGEDGTLSTEQINWLESQQEQVENYL